MSIAGRHGKLSERAADSEGWSRVEDLLTADVFGAYRYLPPRLGVIPFLMRARSASGQTLGDWLNEQHMPPSRFDGAEIIFWPQLAGREPDLLVVFTVDEAPEVAVLVEAKLHSPQHAIEGLSQVGFYAQHHVLGDYEDLDEELPAIRPVVFLTKHAECQAEQLRAAERELGELEDDDKSAFGVFWASWQTARELAAELWELEQQNVAEQPWLRLLEDLVEDLSSRGFGPRREASRFPLPSLGVLDGRCAVWLGSMKLAARPGPSAGFPLERITALSEISAELRDWRIA